MSDSFTGQQINASVIRLTAAQWTAQPYVLPAGVIGIESDTGAFKLGDGETAWADLLAYSAPTGVKVYRALLTQSGTDAPVATVLENTLGGTVVWTWNSAGSYVGTLAGAFPFGNTVVQINPPMTTASDPAGAFEFEPFVPPDSVVISFTSLTDFSFMDIDGSCTPNVQILVYP